MCTSMGGDEPERCLGSCIAREPARLIPVRAMPGRISLGTEAPGPCLSCQDITAAARGGTRQSWICHSRTGAQAPGQCLAASPSLPSKYLWSPRATELCHSRAAGPWLPWPQGRLFRSLPRAERRFTSVWSLQSGKDRFTVSLKVHCVLVTLMYMHLFIYYNTHLFITSMLNRTAFDSCLNY